MEKEVEILLLIMKFFFLRKGSAERFKVIERNCKRIRSVNRQLFRQQLLC